MQFKLYKGGIDMFIKDPYNILLEACKSECGECNDLAEEEVEQELEDEYAEVEEVEDGETFYNADMVNVIRHDPDPVEEDADVYYLVDMEDLGKYMDVNEIKEPEEAIEQIADANGIEESAICIVIESDDAMKQLIEEAKNIKKSDAKKIKLGKISGATKLIKDLKNKGIKLKKKKSKKK